MKNATEDILFHPHITIDVVNWANRIGLLPNVSGGHYGTEFLPKYAHEIAYWYPYEEWCTEHHPDVDPVRCLTVLLHHKNGTNNMPASSDPHGAPTMNDPKQVEFFDGVYKISSYIGLGLYIFKINLVSPR